MFGVDSGYCPKLNVAPTDFSSIDLAFASAVTSVFAPKSIEVVTLDVPNCVKVITAIVPEPLVPVVPADVFIE